MNDLVEYSSFDGSLNFVGHFNDMTANVVDLELNEAMPVIWLVMVVSASFSLVGAGERSLRLYSGLKIAK